MLCVELLTGAGMLWNRNRPELNLMRREEFCEVELIPKTVADRQDVADAGKTGESGAPVRMRLQKTRIFMVSGWIGKPWRFSFITGRM